MNYLESVAAEIARREIMWAGVLSTTLLDASAIRALGIYSGQAGIYADKHHTRSLLAPQGIAVSFLHTGTSYADDLSENGVIYHYPQTARAGSHDEGEIESARTANRLGIPVFVVMNGKRPGSREVREASRKSRGTCRLR